MSAVIEPQTSWLNSDFWERLDRLETQHRRIQSAYETVRRQLDRIDPKINPEFREIWARYCEVIAELDRAAGELELLRFGGI